MGAVAIIIVSVMVLIFVAFVVLLLLGLYADRNATRKGDE